MLIGVSRVVVSAHSVSEVIAGTVLEGSVALSFIWISNPAQKIVLNRSLVAFNLAALVAASYLKPTPTQLWIEEVALYLSGHDKPFDPRDWGFTLIDETKTRFSSQR